MTDPTARTYPDWKAPAADGASLVWPEPAELLAQTRANRDSLSVEPALLQNVPLAELRRSQRRAMGIDDAATLIATGHQTELYHPGVWVKDAMIDAAAARVGGVAVHFAVDTDQPKHLSLRWPGGSRPVTDDPRVTSAEWSGLLAPPSDVYLNELTTQFARAAADWPFAPLAGEFLGTLGPAAASGGSLSAAITAAAERVDSTLGLSRRSVVASTMWFDDAYLAFVHHVLARASAYAMDYNASLREYRDEHRIDSATRPMPDLRVSDDGCEVPFWLDDLRAGGRRRATVVPAGKGWALEVAGGQFVFDERADGWSAAAALRAFLKAVGARLSPRALTLTTFLRLLVCDQFVHGIGGGRYDQVTDRLLRRHFGVEPPAFSVTTATLFFPTAVGRQRACLPCVEQEGHRLRHRVLGEEKMRMVEEINALPRRSTSRRRVFAEMHGKLAGAVADHPGVRRWEERYREAKERSATEQSVFDRELFYAVQPRDRLERLIAEYRTAFAGA